MRIGQKSRQLNGIQGFSMSTDTETLADKFEQIVPREFRFLVDEFGFEINGAVRPEKALSKQRYSEILVWLVISSTWRGY